jgi:site-specific DNA-methyltransferase (adenine-specific)
MMLGSASLPQPTAILIAVAAVKIGSRHRQDMGDIDALAASIAEVGLLHPIVVTPNNELIAGARRLRAFRQLGRSEIPATVIDLAPIVPGEYAENTFRKAFSPSENVSIAEALEPIERKAAKERQASAGPSSGPGKKAIGSGKFPDAVKGRALDHVGKVVGMDRKTLTKAKAVVTAAKADPKRYGGLQDQMDRSGNVDRAHKALETTRKREAFEATIQRAKITTGSQIVVHADCLVHLATMAPASVDVVMTSPPYNVGIEYRQHQDNMPRDAYLAWLADVGAAIRRVLKPNGSFFLNVGSTNKDPWIEADVAAVMRQLFCLQNHIIWIKSVAIEGRMAGHYKPIASKRFLNQSHESVFHFALEGDVEIDRLAIGVPFKDKSNIERRGHAADLHCGGNAWFIPYQTVQSTLGKFNHPAGFPVELAERCIKLHGLKRGLVVLDPFLGSGTTLIAAEKLGCSGIGVEIDEHYAKIATARFGTTSVAG